MGSRSPFCSHRNNACPGAYISGAFKPGRQLFQPSATTMFDDTSPTGPLRYDPGLAARQAEVARDSAPTRAFMGGEARIGLRVDTEVYEAARLANLKSMGGLDVWREPEFVADMARRHPEIVVPAHGTRFFMGGSAGPTGAKRMCRHGRVKSRTVFRKINDRLCRITEDAETRTVEDADTGEILRRVCLDTGEELA